MFSACYFTANLLACVRQRERSVSKGEPGAKRHLGAKTQVSSQQIYTQAFLSR